MSVIKIDNVMADDDEIAEYTQISSEVYDRTLSVSGIYYSNLPDVVSINIKIDEASVEKTRQALTETLAWLNSLPSQ